MKPRSPSNPAGPPHSLCRTARSACRRCARLTPAAPRGAALLTREGTVFSACDLAAPPNTGLAVCAERAAVEQAVLAGRKRFVTLVLRAGPTGTEDAGSPCGPCLQVLAEFSPEVRIFWGTAGDPRGGGTARELLPGAFELPRGGEKPR